MMIRVIVPGCYDRRTMSSPLSLFVNDDLFCMKKNGFGTTTTTDCYF